MGRSSWFPSDGELVPPQQFSICIHNKTRQRGRGGTYTSVRACLSISSDCSSQIVLGVFLNVRNGSWGCWDEWEIRQLLILGFASAREILAWALGCVYPPTSHCEDQTKHEWTRLLYQGPSLVWLSREAGSAVLLPASLQPLAALATLEPGREGGLLGHPGPVVSRGCFCGVGARLVAGSRCIRIPGTRAGRGDGAHVAAAACPHMLSAMLGRPSPRTAS